MIVQDMQNMLKSLLLTERTTALQCCFINFLSYFFVSPLDSKKIGTFSKSMHNVLKGGIWKTTAVFGGLFNRCSTRRFWGPHVTPGTIFDGSKVVELVLPYVRYNVQPCSTGVQPK